MERIGRAGTLQEEEPAAAASTADKEQGLNSVFVVDAAAASPFKTDSGWRAWTCVFSSFCLYTLCVGYSFAFGVFQAEYSLVQFPEASDTAISFIGATNQAALVVILPFVGRPCERFGLRIVTLVGGIVMAIGLLAASFCNSVATLIVTQGIILGIGNACIFVPAAALPAPWFVKRRSMAMGLAASGAGAGGIAWSYIVRGCISALNYRWALRVSAIVTVAITGIALVFMRSPPHITKARKEGSLMGSIKSMVKEKWLVVFWIAFCIAMFGYSTPPFYLPSYIQTQAGASASLGSTISAVYNVGSMFGRISLGFIADKLGVMNAFNISLALAAITQLLMWMLASGNLPVSFVFSFLYGFFGSGAIGISPAVLATHLDPVFLASISGIFYTCEIPGFLTGAPISGAILSKSGYHAVIGYSGGCMFIGALLCLVARSFVNRKFLTKM